MRKFKTFSLFFLLLFFVFLHTVYAFSTNNAFVVNNVSNNVSMSNVFISKKIAKINQTELDNATEFYTMNVIAFFNATLFNQDDQFVSYVSFFIVLIVLFLLSLKFYPVGHFVALLVLLALLTKYVTILNAKTGNFGYHILITACCLIFFSLKFALRKL